MKVVEDSPGRLVLEDVPWILGAVFAAMILLPVGIGSGWS